MSTSSAFRGIDLIIGFGNPISSKDMIFNCHFLMNKYEWDESVTFSNLLKLKYSIDYEKIHVFPLKRQSNLTSLTAFYDFHTKFTDEFTEKNFLSKYLTLLREDENELGSIALRRHDMPYFKSILSQLESWILFILNHLIDFSIEIRNSCQHFFFTSTILTSCFRILLKSKEEIDSLLEEIQSVKSIVLEKASSSSGSSIASGGGGSAKSNGSDHGKSSFDDSHRSSAQLAQGQTGLPPPHPTHGGSRNSSSSSSAAHPPAYPSALGYNPLDHLTVVSTPSYHAESNYTTAIIPTAITSITLPSSSSADEDSPKMVIKGQPLSSSSPLAMKLAALKEASLEKKIAEGKALGNGREKNERSYSSFPFGIASEKSTVSTLTTATIPTAATSMPPSINGVGMREESPSSSEKVDNLINLLTEEGIACLFFIPTNNAGEGSKICSAQVMIKNYIPSVVTTSSISSSSSVSSASSASGSSDGNGGKKEKSKSNKKEEGESVKSYDPSSCVLEVHLNSEELQINCVLSFPILLEVERVFSGKGFSVIPPSSFSAVSSLFHILIKGKPEVLLSSLSVPPSASSSSSASATTNTPYDVIAAFNTIISNLKLFSDKKVTTVEKEPPAIVVAPMEEEKSDSKKQRISIFSKFGEMLSPSSSGGNKKHTGHFTFNMDEKLEKLDENKNRLNMIDNTTSGYKNVTSILRTMNDPSMITISLFFWIQVNEGRLFTLKKKTRLLIVKSDSMIEIYKVPKELDKSNSPSSSPNESKETLRLTISKKLEQMKRSKFLRSPLIELGFTAEVSDRLFDFILLLFNFDFDFHFLENLFD
jgi:hypothetical protein